MQSKVLCITSTMFLDDAKKFVQDTFKDASIEVSDIKKLILSATQGIRTACKRRNIVVAFLHSGESQQAIDLIIGFTALCSAQKKYIRIDSDSSFEKMHLFDVFRAFANLLRDSLYTPLYIALAGLRFRQYDRKRKSPICQTNTIWYLRTDIIGELKAGGSVAHTEGVINGFRNIGFIPKIFLSGIIPVVSGQGFDTTCIKRSSLLRNVPELLNIAFSKKVYREILRKREDIDFIYQRYSLNDYTGAVLAEKLRVPFILEYNGSDVWVAKNWGMPLIFERTAEKIEIANLRAADLIVVVSNVLKDELLRRGIEGEKILVNPNGVDETKYHPEIDGKSIREKYHAGNKIIVGFIGTFGKWHGAEILAESIKRVVEKNGNIHFLFIGDGLTMPLVKEVINNDNVSQHVTFAGLIPQEEAPRYLAACNILVSPHVPNPDGTPFFGSPTKLFEYMAMGKAIIASDLEQIGEVLKHKETALMVTPGNVSDLADGIIMLADDSELRTSLGKNAREEVVARYTWKEHTRKIIEQLKEVIGKDV